MNKTKRIIALILTVMMVNSTIGYKSIKRVNAHYYGPINISEGSIVVDASNQNVSPSLTAPGMLNVVIKGVSNTNNITFDGGLSRVTLSSLMIDTKTNYEDTKTWHPAIVLKNNAKVILTIENRVSLLGGGPNPAIHVPEGCELIIRSNSGDGNLFVRGGSNSAGIGANADFVGFDGNTEPTTVGKIHIESGTVRAEGKGAAAGIGGGYFGNTGQITISGGTVYAKGGGGNMPGDINSSLAGAGIGGGHSGVVEKINITGGNVIAVGGHKGNQSGAGIGAGSGWGYEGNYQSITEDSKRTCGQINITGGNISATGGNNNAVNAIGYGLSPTYDISGDLYAGRVTISDGVRVNTNGGAINPLTNAQNFNHYNLDMTIYDGRLTEAVEEATIKIDGKTFYGNLRVDENEKYKGLMDFSPLYHGTLSGEQALEISAGKYSWSTRVNFSESNMNYTASIGNKLYPVDLWFYDDAITSDLSGVTLSAQQGGRALNANPAQGIQDLVYDKRIRKQENGVGKMTVYMPAGLSDLTIEASGLNAGNPINLSDRTIKDSEAGTILVAWETDTTTEQFSGTLDISHGDIVFEDKGGKLDITYIAESGGGATTLTGQSYRNEYEVVQSSSGATSNRIIFINTMQFTNVNLNSVNMKVSGRDHEAGRAIDLFKAKAKLTLNGENIIDCGNTERNKSGKEMGIRAGAGSELTIDGSGSLEIINPSYYGVGIGGYYVSYTFGDTITEAAGIIRIEGGSLRVRERLGAAIGNGFDYRGENVGRIYITGGTISTPNNQKARMNITPTDHENRPVYYTTVDLARVYGSNADVGNASIIGDSYGFQGVKTDSEGIVHLYLPENSETNASFNNIPYQGSVTADGNNLLVSICDHVYNQDGFCNVCDELEPASWNQASDAYEISNYGQLTWFSNLVNGTLADNVRNASANGKLMKNIVTGSRFVPIGSESSHYTGVFDGGSHTVTLDINNSSSRYQGLFGVVSGGVTVKNVGVDGKVSGGAFTAGIVGGSLGDGTVTISNCWNKATINSTAENAAGIFGCRSSRCDIRIDNCYNMGSITGERESAAIGGFLGWNQVVSNCYNVGSVSGFEPGKSFGRHSGNNPFFNCYQLSTIGAQKKVESKTLSDFSSGEVTYLLNNSRSQGTPEEPLVWGQILKKDDFPVFYNGKNTVYGVGDASNKKFYNSLVAEVSDIGRLTTEITVNGDVGAKVYYASSKTPLTDASEVEWLSTQAEEPIISQSGVGNLLLRGLAPNTTYTYYFVSKLGDQYSNIASLTFTTKGFNGKYGVITSTKTEAGDNIEGELSSFAEYAFNSSATVRANNLKGYSFAGWYEASSEMPGYSGDPLSEEKVYTFVVDRDLYLVGVYKPVAVESVTLDQTELSLNQGDTATLTATVLPEDVINKRVTWKSNDSSVATVDAEGLVRAVGQGKTSITATTEDGEHVATCSLKVINPSVPTLNQDGFYEIENGAHLRWFSGLVDNSLSGVRQNEAANGILMADIVAGSDFRPIGAGNQWTSSKRAYRGTFDGNGNTVTLSIDDPYEQAQGLFGMVYDGAVIKNVGVDGEVRGAAFTAGIVGMSKTTGKVTISNCWNEATVISTAQNAAGIFGSSVGDDAEITISNCYNSGSITGARESAAISGWLGRRANVSGCYN